MRSEPSSVNEIAVVDRVLDGDSFFNRIHKTAGQIICIADGGSSSESLRTGVVVGGGVAVDFLQQMRFLAQEWSVS